MKKILLSSTNGFTGEAEQQEDGTYHGKLRGIPDLVTFESDTYDNLMEEFHAAIEDYVQLRSTL